MKAPMLPLSTTSVPKTAAIPIFEGMPARELHALGEVRAQVTAFTIFSAPPPVSAVARKLRAEALAVGATAVVDVRYLRGRSKTARRTVTAFGTAVVLASGSSAVRGGGR